jgi:hypothetical protein
MGGGDMHFMNVLVDPLGSPMYLPNGLQARELAGTLRFNL